MAELVRRRSLARQTVARLLPAPAALARVRPGPGVTVISTPVIGNCAD